MAGGLLAIRDHQHMQRDVRLLQLAPARCLRFAPKHRRSVTLRKPALRGHTARNHIRILFRPAGAHGAQRPPPMVRYYLAESGIPPHELHQRLTLDRGKHARPRQRRAEEIVVRPMTRMRSLYTRTTEDSLPDVCRKIHARTNLRPTRRANHRQQSPPASS